MKEIWVDIIGYENEYQISNFGNVKSKYRVVENKGSFSGKISKKSMILKQSISKGYHWVKLQKNGRKKHMYVHRLVAIHFIPNKENLKEINHKDFNKSNNHVSNLEWCNRYYNIHHFTSKKEKSSKYTGVSLEKSTGKWICYINIDNNRLNLGRFKTEEEAYKKRVEYIKNNTDINYERII